MPAATLAAASTDRRRALRVVTPGDGVAAAAYDDAAVEAVGDPVVSGTRTVTGVRQAVEAHEVKRMTCHQSGFTVVELHQLSEL